LLGVIPPVAALVGIGAERLAYFATRRRSAELRPWLACAIVSPLVVMSLYYYFSVYPDQFVSNVNGYADQNTRDAQRMAETVRDTVPKGARLYWVFPDEFDAFSPNPGHPALDWGLRDYPLHAIKTNGDLLGVRNPSQLENEGRTVAYVLPERSLGMLERIREKCETEREVYTGDRTQSEQPDLLVILTTISEPTHPDVSPCLDQ
jgi:hypothetical protein